MIICIEILTRHVHAIHGLVGIVWTNLGTVHIVKLNKANVDAAEVELSAPKQHVDKMTEPEKSAIT